MHYYRMAAVLCSAFALSACQGSSNQQSIETCWSPDTKKLATSLTKDVAVDAVVSIVKTTKGPLSDEVKRNIENAVSVDLSNYYVANNDQKAGHLTCGASLRFTLKRNDGTSLSSEGSMEFEVYKGEGGNVVSVPKMPISALVNSAN